METQIFHHAKIQSSKKSSKRNQNPSKHYNSITNLKFQHKARISSFKNPHIKIDLSVTQRSKSVKLLYSIMNLNTISLPRQAKANKRKKTPTQNQAMVKDLQCIPNFISKFQWQRVRCKIQILPNFETFEFPSDSSTLT